MKKIIKKILDALDQIVLGRYPPLITLSGLFVFVMLNVSMPDNTIIQWGQIFFAMVFGFMLLSFPFLQQRRDKIFLETNREEIRKATDEISKSLGNIKSKYSRDVFREAMKRVGQ